MTDWTCNCIGPQGTARLCPCREREEHAAEVYGLNGQINVQAENWKADQVEKARQSAIIEKQATRIDKLQAHITKLEYRLSAKGQAEQAFKGAEYD